MHTSSKTVTFVRPFTLPGLDGVQPPGRYLVQTDEERLPTLLHPAARRVATWLVVPTSSHAGITEFVRIDPAELDAALAADAADGWSPGTEAKVDRLLEGQVMTHAVRSAGLTLREFKKQLRDVAARLRAREARGAAKQEDQ